MIPKKCLGTYFDIVVPLENFQRRSQAKLIFYKTLILSTFWMPKARNSQNLVKTAKNEHLLTFMPKNFLCCVVRQHQCFQKMPEILKKCLTTYNDVAAAKEKILQPSEVSHVSKNFQIFLLFPLNFGY